MEAVGQYWLRLHREGSLRQPIKAVAVSDAELVREALRGSQVAFRDLAHRYERPVRSLLTRLLGNPSRAEELAQDTFVRAFQRLDSYNPACKFASWLLTIAHHLGIDELRRRHVHTEPLDDGATHHQIADVRSESPAAASERAQLGKMLDAAIRSLRSEEAELVALRYEQELTLDEIMDITGLPMGTIKSSLHRARRKLAASLTTVGWGRGA